VKIARFSVEGEVSYGILDEDAEELVVLAGDPMFAGYRTTGERVSLGVAKLLAPVIPRSKVVGVGLNYAAHSDDLGQEQPADRPLLFLKPNTSVIGPGEAIQLPPVEGRIVHEGELAVVVGRIAKQVPLERAHEVVFGYTIGNDVSARDQMFADGQWARAKGYDTFCPLGPYIETELDPANLDIRTFVDGEPRRSGNTSDMRFSVAEIIAAASDVWTLLPGDVILTGTPAGPGGFTAGQTVDITIEGIGTLTNPARNRD
jgi:2-keto-4-pentenoate hydratase/2-oxohepta-3-ene-1,7-dioic acid hydratase in catechol pathway